MAYNRNTYIKRAQYIIEVYKMYKFSDVPDSYIVRVHFPKHNIFMTYRQWMNIKNTPFPKSENQFNIKPIN